MKYSKRLGGTSRGSAAPWLPPMAFRRWNQGQKDEKKSRKSTRKTAFHRFSSVFWARGVTAASARLPSCAFHSVRPAPKHASKDDFRWVLAWKRGKSLENSGKINEKHLKNIWKQRGKIIGNSEAFLSHLGAFVGPKRRWRKARLPGTGALRLPLVVVTARLLSAEIQWNAWNYIKFNDNTWRIHWIPMEIPWFFLTEMVKSERLRVETAWSPPGAPGWADCPCSSSAAAPVLFSAQRSVEVSLWEIAKSRRLKMKKRVKVK